MTRPFHQFFPPFFFSGPPHPTQVEPRPSTRGVITHTQRNRAHRCPAQLQNALVRHFSNYHPPHPYPFPFLFLLACHAWRKTAEGGDDDEREATARDPTSGPCGHYVRSPFLFTHTYLHSCPRGFYFPFPLIQTRGLILFPPHLHSPLSFSTSKRLAPHHSAAALSQWTRRTQEGPP